MRLGRALIEILMYKFDIIYYLFNLIYSHFILKIYFEEHYSLFEYFNLKVKDQLLNLKPYSIFKVNKGVRHMRFKKKIKEKNVDKHFI